ncbi:MAG: rane protein [Panacagrimonas sp.]|jgi:chloramphenicol-sensitive protein RarD|nr:EamA family transporter RarD [Panacagrimonas sp.]MCC2658150.1 rane protein [Panacagrimonas sp.]
MTPTQPTPEEARRGFVATVGAFIAWGLFPLYWRELQMVAPLQITAHRILWCTVFVVGFLMWKQGFGWLRATLSRPRAAPLLLASSLLISVNWVLYIWAVNAGHVVESALGYFINPLVNVLLGVAVLGERLNLRQWVSVALAAFGVAWLTWKLGRLPWIALALAFSFGTYGLIRKIVSVESVPGLGVESLIMFVPALGYLVFCEAMGTGGFGHVGRYEDLLMILAGVVTAMPLIWFAYGARRIPLSLVGIIQYIGPTLQLLTGVFLFGEPFSEVQLIGFGCIWGALALYALDGLWRIRMRGYG